VPIHFLLTVLFGKAAASAGSKGIAAKASAAGAKSASGHHTHRRLAKKIADKVADKVRDGIVDRVAQKAGADGSLAGRGGFHGDVKRNGARRASHFFVLTLPRRRTSFRNREQQ
jgi:hypothetical protein